MARDKRQRTEMKSFETKLLRQILLDKNFDALQTCERYSVCENIIMRKKWNGLENLLKNVCIYFVLFEFLKFLPVNCMYIVNFSF